jgi:hypothetical protein
MPLNRFKARDGSGRTSPQLLCHGKFRDQVSPTAAQKSTAAERAADEVRQILHTHLGKAPPIPLLEKWARKAQLSYDCYQEGRAIGSDGKRLPFPAALLLNPLWVLAPAVRSRAHSSLSRMIKRPFASSIP